MVNENWKKLYDTTKMTLKHIGGPETEKACFMLQNILKTIPSLLNESEHHDKLALQRLSFAQGIFIDIIKDCCTRRECNENIINFAMRRLDLLALELTPSDTHDLSSSARDSFTQSGEHFY